ncbi:ricin B-like lectin EULS3 [Durio zibethinus]|uniref:Ricin B-like lectin EULS3 n=1 Tax=Durio zibethinus TaxID=66656 RepID=A0A6P5WTF8_DURZI|nr:ricin B-like lectin EULS3 [Durio zibethinus]
MEFPYGHDHSHTHHHRNDGQGIQERPPAQYRQHNEFAPPAQYQQPPPPRYQQPGFDGPSQQPPSSYFQQPGFAAAPPSYQTPSYHHQQTEILPPPASNVTDVHHSGGSHQLEHGSYNYSPAPAHVTHVPHESSQERIDHHHQSEGHHSFSPHLSSFTGHQSHSGFASELSKKPTVKVYCKADPNFHLTIRDGKVILAPSDPADEFQHWYKDQKFSTRVKDEEGFPSFSLVNKATGQAIKHSIGASHPVQLIPYRSDNFDQSILWSESKVMDDGYRAVRMINNIRLNMDAFQGDKNSGGVNDGTTTVLWEWNKGDNQLWKIVPY